MRQRTVKYGLNLTTAAVLLVVVTTFFHVQVGSIAGLTASQDTRLVFIGLFWGGVCGFLGIVVAVAGLLRDSAPEGKTALMPALVILAGAIVLFFLLLYSSFSSPGPSTPGRGETVII